MRFLTRIRAVSAAAACLTVMFAAAGCGGPPTPVDPMQALVRFGQPLDSALPASVLSAHLVDSTGAPRTLGSMSAKVLVIQDMMTLCQATCPLDTAAMISVARTIEADGLSGHVEFISLTVDPERDTPAQLAAYKRQFVPIPANWTTLTGSPDAVHRLLKALGVYWQKVGENGAKVNNWRTGARLTHDINHSDEVFFVDAARERFLLDGPPQVHDAASIPSRLRRFLDAEGRKNIQDPDPGSWTPAQMVMILRSLTNSSS